MLADGNSCGKIDFTIGTFKPVHGWFSNILYQNSKTRLDHYQKQAKPDNF